MRDRSELERISDRDLEALISGLPRRAPAAALRQRILKSAAPRRPILRPAYAFAALVVLAVLDVAAISWQDRTLALAPAPARAPALAVRPADPDDVEWLREIGVADLGLLGLGGRSAERPAVTHRELPWLMLDGGEGG